MSATTEHPKIFISYSWTSVEHEQFVMGLATSLRNHGVDAILDKWDLKPGQDKYVFMESMVVDSEVLKVLVLCDRKYQEKANTRAGGVGTESQIISQELYGKVKQTKFIPIVCDYDDDGQPCLPVFMKGLIYIDVSSEERYGEGLDQLLRLIYEQPFHQKPKLGGAPAFVSNGGTSYVRELGAAIRAIQDGKPNRQGLETLFVKGVLTELNKLYVTPDGKDYDEGVYQAIIGTKELRDQVADYVEAVAAFSGDDPSAIGPFIKLMEGIGAHFGPPENAGSYYPGWIDFYAFFALEAFLIQTAALLRHERWKTLRRLVDTTYILRGDHRGVSPARFIAFDAHLQSLDEHRNQRLKLNRVYVSADLLKERCSAEKTSFNELMEADVFLALKSVVAGSESSDGWISYWGPRTSVYASHGNKHPVFLRASDETTRNGIHTAIGVRSGVDLKAKLDSSKGILHDLDRAGGRSFSRFSFLEAINVHGLTK
ncbi:toll/interleukin-1 receptor domain-containing protein [Acidovorax sp. PRC11]|uniref:toll/interleukin-1 receptor domain-containing protein n=1 Tax=Acidovorax sp. PRC11 TaxID=2962592 RepID=UPI0028824B6C|nr:toll/interleukin-1 receptor domain-containing protein [Acidovorax sp. PRC11]MDT0138139.1 toll/interleukin-1 receptor domain-containing protein [Acidovorax sp. PRC11]